MREAARPTAGPPRTIRPPERALGRPRPSWGWGCGTPPAAIPACPREALLGVRHGPPTRHRHRHRHRHRRMPSRGEAVARLPPGRPDRLLLAAAAPRRLPALPRRTCAPCAGRWLGRNPGTPGARLAPGQGAPPGRGVSSGVPPGWCAPRACFWGTGPGGTRVPQGPGWLPARARLPAGAKAPGLRLAGASTFATCFGAVVPGPADGVLVGRCVARGSRPRGRGCEYA